MNRQMKRQMAKSGGDKPTRPTAKNAAAANALKKERTSPAQYLDEVRGEMKKVVWPTKPEVVNSTIIVLVAVVFMGALIFGFDSASVKFTDFLFG